MLAKNENMLENNSNSIRKVFRKLRIGLEKNSEMIRKS